MVLRRAVPPPPGKRRACSQEWMEGDVAYSEADSPDAELAALELTVPLLR